MVKEESKEVPFCNDEDESKPLNVRGLKDCKPRPPCPQGIDFRSQSEWVPGKNCKLVKLEDLPDCPYQDPSSPRSPKSIEDLIPGVTCKPLPKCPDFGSDSQGINVRQNQEGLIPGVTCIPSGESEDLPFCPEDSDEQGINVRSNDDLVPGVTCKLLPECPQGIDFRSQSKWVPGKNCKLVKSEELPFCPDDSDNKQTNVRSNEDLVPGVTCKPLPECPQGIDFRSQSEWVPGKNCKLAKVETATTNRNIFIPPPSDVEPVPETTPKPKELPPKERWRLKATRDQIRLVDSAREKGTY